MDAPNDDSTAPLHLNAALYLPFTGRGVGQTCMSLAGAIGSPDIAPRVFAPVFRRSVPKNLDAISTLPWLHRYVPYRLVSLGARAHLERRMLEELAGPRHDRSLVWLWPGASDGFIDELKTRGFTLVREMTNCHRGTAKQILDDEYLACGLQPAHGITESSVTDETRQLDKMDHIFCPNGEVEASVRKFNPSRTDGLLGTSYGWGRPALASTRATLDAVHGPTVLFVGSVAIGKGVHILLEAWVKSRIRGRLVLTGAVDPIVAQRYRDILAREDVVVTGYVDDIGALYRSADIFAFPTLVEGGPQVTYEACSFGLPVLTTPMGRGRIVVDGRNGLVRPPADRAAWVEGLKQLAEDSSLREKFAQAALADAAEYKWTKVGAARRQQLLEVARRPR